MKYDKDYSLLKEVMRIVKIKEYLRDFAPLVTDEEKALPLRTLSYLIGQK
ncbi:MAG: hypothetical protein ACYS32_11565 [Planctomycetota bacterium]|jgi:hypothetical protein